MTLGLSPPLSFSFGRYFIPMQGVVSLLFGAAYLSVRSIVTPLIGVLAGLTNTQGAISRLAMSGVRLIVGVSLRTVRLVYVPIPTGQILTMSHWFKMLRVNTDFVATQMVKVKAFGNWADQQLVSQSVGKYFKSFRRMATDLQLSIPRLHYRPYPRPTFCRGALLNLRPKTLLHRLWGGALRAHQRLPSFQVAHVARLQIKGMHIAYHSKGV